MTKIAATIEVIINQIGRAVAWLVLLMVLGEFIIVALRYLFQLNWIWFQESISYMHASVFLLAAAYSLQHNEHVRIDIFYRDMMAKKKAWVNLLGTVFFLLPTCVVIIWMSWDYVQASWQIWEGSRETGGLPGVFLLKTLLIIFPGLLILQGLVLLIRSVEQILVKDV